MNQNELYWMDYSIKISNMTSESSLKVGAVLVSNQNEVIAFSYLGENGIQSWSKNLLNKVFKKGVLSAQSLYLTINTVFNSDFDLNEVLSKIKIVNIYVGLPDPALNQYLYNDPVLNLKNTQSYTDIMQQKILELNKLYFLNSKQNIKTSPYYSMNRISNLVINKLKKKGLEIDKQELKQNNSINDLTIFLVNKYQLQYQYMQTIVQEVVSEAFDEKYSTYNYSEDARSIDDKWLNNFWYVYRKNVGIDISNLAVLDVGVGSGNEAKALFSNCKDIIFVDIARNGLESVKQKLPQSKTIIASAENLFALSSKSFDLYISLRTYNSSFFNTKEALIEAHRVLKSGGKLIISIANGFLDVEHKSIIPGLIIPGTDFVNLYRGFEMSKKLCNELVETGFTNIKIYTTNTEIYLTATCF